jgi:hypothetical protein
VLPSAALALAVEALPAFGQFPDVLSESECPGCVAALAPSPFDGVWSSALTAAVEPGWALEDFYCFAACTSEGRAQASELLGGTETAQRSALELYPQAVAANVRSVEGLAGEPSPSAGQLPGFSCDRLGFAAQVVSPLPLELETQSDRVVLRYEEFGAKRTISLDGHVPHSHERATFGVSTGRFEGDVLVIETSGVPAGHVSDWLGGFAHTEALHATERYAVSADGRWLDLELTLTDPSVFATPLVVTKRWVRAPGARIMRHGCDVMSAGLSGVFAEYLDPRIVENARRRRALGP